MKNKKLTAKLFCVTPPDEKQREGIADFLEKKYGARPEIEIVEDKSLVSGFRLETGGDVYDWSAKGRVEKLAEQLKSVSGEFSAKPDAKAQAPRPTAKLFCVNAPSDAQRRGMADFLEKKYGIRPDIEVIIDKTLVGGFRLEFGDNVYDWSAKAA